MVFYVFAFILFKKLFRLSGTLLQKFIKFSKVYLRMGLIPEIMLVVIVDIYTFIFQKRKLQTYSRPVVAVLVSKGKKTESKCNTRANNQPRGNASQAHLNIPNHLN